MIAIETLISKWPSATALASDINVKDVTVRAWKQRGSIPIRYWQPIAKAAQKRAIDGINIETLALLHTGMRQ